MSWRSGSSPPSSSARIRLVCAVLATVRSWRAPVGLLALDDDEAGGRGRAGHPDAKLRVLSIETTSRDPGA